MPIYAFSGTEPRLNTDSWVAPTAVLIGDVWLASGASVWFGAVLRGDDGPIAIGEGSNVQDLCVFHAAPGQALTIGRSCTIGHRAILHGCSIGDCCMIGAGATVLDGAKIGRNCVVGAGALILDGTNIPDNSLVFGQPGAVLRLVPQNHAENQRRKAFDCELKWRHERGYRATNLRGAA